MERYWVSWLNQEPPSMWTVRRRTTAWHMDGLVAPPPRLKNHEFSTTAHADRHSIAPRHLTSISECVGELIEWIKVNGATINLGTVATSMRETRDPIMQTETQKQNKRNFDMITRADEAMVISEMVKYLENTETLPQRMQSPADYIRLLTTPTFAKWARTNPSQTYRYLKRMHEWSQGVPDSVPDEAGYCDNRPREAIILFRNSTLNWAYMGHGITDQVSAESLNKLFGKYMDDLLYYPFAESVGSASLSADRLLWYKLTTFPGAQSEWFFVTGVFWHKHCELTDYIDAHGDPTRVICSSDESVLRNGYLSQKPLLTHLLLPIKLGLCWRVTVSMQVETGGILGLLPGRLRYVEDTGEPVQSHWIRLPNCVYFEPALSPFESIFYDHDEHVTVRNVGVGYEWVSDNSTGMGP